MPDEVVGSVNDPRTLEENGVRWNEKWIYRLEHGERRIVYWHRYDCRGVFAASAGREREPGVALSGPPPLAPIGLGPAPRRQLLARGRARHAPAPARRVPAPACAGPRPSGTFVVQLGVFRGWLDVEDTAFFVTAYDAAQRRARALGPLARAARAATRSRSIADDVLRCTVKGRFAARFTRAAQAHLLDARRARRRRDSSGARGRESVCRASADLKLRSSSFGAVAKW